MARGLLIFVIVGALAVGALVGIGGYRLATPVPPPIVTPVPTPDIEAMVEARVAEILRARQAIAPSPTPAAVTPQIDRAIVQEFAQAYLALVEEWDAFHRDYDTFRLGDTCSKEVMEKDLSHFVTQFRELAAQAKAMAHPQPVRAVWMSLVEAIEKEEVALLELRDSWQPGDFAPFEAFEQVRAEVEGLRREVEGKVADLAAPPSQEALDFARAHAQIAQRWDAFHSDYNAWRLKASSFRPKEEQPEQVNGEPTQLDEELTQLDGELTQLVSQFWELAAQAKAMAHPQPVRAVWASLVEAIEKEEAALLQLRDSWQPGDSAPFEAFEQVRAEVERLRREVEGKVADLAAPPSQEALDFAQAHAQIAQRWDAFHSDYNAWRLRDGSCEREKMIQTLTQLLLRFQGVVSKARALPHPELVLPIAETVVKAAEKEELALRKLRDTWRPFDPASFEAYEHQRKASNELRRQAESSLQTLLAKYGLSWGELQPSQP